MSTVCVYSFADATGLTKYVDSAGDFVYNGTWSGSGTYFATPLNAVTYGAAQYMCIRDNVGDNPQRVPTRTRPQSWSIMSLLYEYQCGPGTLTPTEALAEAAWELAQTGTNIAWAAYYLAQIGTNTGSAAYALAGSAYSIGTEAYNLAGTAYTLAGSAAADAALAVDVANGAFAIAVEGTNAAAAAYALAQIGTNTGTAALNAAASAQSTANGAFLIAVAGTNAAANAQSTADSAFNIAVAGTNAAANAQSTGDAAYLLAQIGTNTGTAAFNLATAGSNLAQQALSLAETGTNLLIVEQGTRAQADQNLQNQIDLLSAGTVTFASPTAEVTLSHVIGSGTKAMRSDSAPKLSQAIAPTWSGYHIFSKGLAVPTLAAVNLTAPVTYLMTDSRGAITLSSNGTAWSDREFALAAGNTEGHFVTLVWTGTGLAEMLNNAVYGGCRVRLQSDYWHPTDYSTMLLRFNGTDWLEMSRTPSVLAEAGSNTASVAQAAYALAQIGTNTGTAAYQLAESGSNIAVAGTNRAEEAYALASIGTNTGTAAYQLAQSGSSIAYSAYDLAVSGTHRACSMILCSAYTPAAIGADAAEVPVPYAWDGNTVNWNANRFVVRVQTAGSSPSVAIEKSSGDGGFTAVSLGTVTLAMNAYEGSNIPGSGTVDSGDKLRFFVFDLGTAQNWTVAVELGV